jgi:8-oxo-dGTP pyrophosphatase MutT (NUDIX family)
MEFRTITTGAGALIYSQRTARYLFLLRDTGSWSGTWALPGGKIDQDESVMVGLAREIREELGGVILAPKFVPIEQFTSADRYFVYHTFFVAVADEFIPILNNEHVGYSWLPLECAPRPLHPGVARTFGFDSVLEKIRTVESYCTV